MSGPNRDSEGSSRQAVDGILCEAGAGRCPIKGPSRLPNRWERGDSVRGEAGFSASARLAGDGGSEVHVRGHPTSVAALLPASRPKAARVSSAARVLPLRQTTPSGGPPLTPNP